jgi:hypothetical protein
LDNITDNNKDDIKIIKENDRESSWDIKFKSKLKALTRILMSYLVKYLVILIRKSKIFYNNYRFIPDYLFRIVKYIISVSGIGAIQNYFINASLRDGAIKRIVDLSRTVIYGLCMGSFTFVSIVRRNVYDLDDNVQAQWQTLWINRLQGFIMGEMFRSYIIYFLFSFLTAIATSVILFLGVDYIYSTYLSKPLEPFADVPYVDKPCDIYVWKTCISENLAPGMGFPYADQELDRCLKMCQSAAKPIRL